MEQEDSSQKIAHLRAASTHVAYEARQFNYCALRLRTEFLNLVDPFLNDTMVTGFAIYGRNLIRFLYPLGYIHPNELHAGKYLEDWNKNHVEMPEKLKTEYQAMHSYAGHLTIIRTEQIKAWDILSIHYLIRSELHSFVAHVEDVRPDLIEASLRFFENTWQWADGFTSTGAMTSFG